MIWIDPPPTFLDDVIKFTGFFLGVFPKKIPAYLKKSVCISLLQLQNRFQYIAKPNLFEQSKNTEPVSVRIKETLVIMDEKFLKQSRICLYKYTTLRK